MDPSKSSKTKNNEGTLHTSQQQPPHESADYSYLDTNSAQDFFLLIGGELNSQSFALAPQYLHYPPGTPFFDRGIAEDKVPSHQDPYYNTKKLSLLSGETVHQEKPACVYEPKMKMQDAELAFHESNAQMLASQEHYCAPKRCCVQFGEAAPSAHGHGSNNSTISVHIPEEPLLSAPSSVAQDIRSEGRKFPAELSEPYCFGMYLNGINERRDEDGVSKVADADCVASENPSLIEPSSSCLPSDVPRNKKVTSAADAENSKKLNQPESKKKRGPKSTGTGTGTGDFKGRCNCKKSACLKLYCECFAAQRFCAESCGCLGCSNKQEYHDKINDTKLKIKSRDALAFAPKIVQNGTDIPSNNYMENDHLKTPSLGKHRSGCTCRKSKCDKKYCECYAGKVGCSSGCRCQGCENSFGKKEEHVAREHLPSRERDNGRVEKVSNSSVHGVSPPTPSLPMPCPTPPLPSSDLRQLSSVSLTYQIRHVIPPESIAGASLDRTQISQQSRLPCLFRDPIRPHSTPMQFSSLPNIWEQHLRSSSLNSGRFINGRKFIMKGVTPFTPSNPSNPKDKDSSQGANGP